MADLAVDTNTSSPLIALLWLFYPMAVLVLVELFLRALNGDDDDDEPRGGKGVRISEPAYATVPVGT